MLRSLKGLERYTVSDTDGEIGRVTNFLLDDRSWIVRYSIVDSGTFFESRRVLISPLFFRNIECSTRRFYLSLTEDKVKSSTNAEVDKHVPRPHGENYYRHYSYPYSLETSALGGSSSYPVVRVSSPPDKTKSSDNSSGNIHLRSVNEVVGYHIQGSDESIGHVQDLLVDDETYAVRYLVVNTPNTWFGKKILVAPRWANFINWQERAVYVDLSRHAIKNSPTWDPEVAVNHEYEIRLYDYYGRPAYWSMGHAKPVGPPYPHCIQHEAEGGGAGAFAGAFGVVAGPPGP